MRIAAAGLLRDDSRSGPVTGGAGRKMMASAAVMARRRGLVGAAVTVSGRAVEAGGDRWPTMVRALERSAERKNTQPMTTRNMVSARRAIFVDWSRRKPRSMISRAPWYRPQTRNVQLAP